MKQIVLTMIAASLLLGCQSQIWPDNNTTRCNSKASCSSELSAEKNKTQQGSITPLAHSKQVVRGQTMPTVPYQYATHFASNKQLSDYASQMSMQLVETLHAFPSGAKVAIASFVELGVELETTNIVGNQLAESFMHQMQQYGLAVVDFKTADDIKVTPQGDFVFSRDLTRLDKRQRIDFVLSGTMQHTPKGMMVHARLVNFHTKIVAASAQQLIPHFVLSSLYSAMHH